MRAIRSWAHAAEEEIWVIGVVALIFLALLIPTLGCGSSSHRSQTTDGQQQIQRIIQSDWRQCTAGLDTRTLAGIRAYNLCVDRTPGKIHLIEP